jgi:predicted N-acetyltransferase YhbS
VPYSQPEPLRGKHSTSAFDSGEESLDIWLDRYARHAEAAGSARTFVTTEDGARVVGYYALTVGQVEPGNATERLLRGQPQGRPVPVVILARLAVDIRHQSAGLGRSLLQDALLRTVRVGEEAGIRAIVANALAQQAADFYVRFGFEASLTDRLHVVLLMKDLRKLLEAAGGGPTLRPRSS